jgi:hypothetical protein
MDLQAIAEWIAHEETLPGRWPSIFSLHAGCLQPRSQPIQIVTFKTEVPLHVRSKMMPLS